MARAVWKRVAPSLVVALLFAALASPAAAGEERRLAVFTNAPHSYGYPLITDPGMGGFPMPNPPPTHVVVDWSYGYSPYGPEPPNDTLGAAMVELGTLDTTYKYVGPVDTTFTYDAQSPGFTAFTGRLTNGINEWLSISARLCYADGRSTTPNLVYGSATTESVWLFYIYPPDPRATDLEGSRVTRIVFTVNDAYVAVHPWYGNIFGFNVTIEFWGLPPESVAIADLIEAVSALDPDPAAGDMLNSDDATNASRRDAMLNAAYRLDGLVDGCELIPAANEAETLLAKADGQRAPADWVNVASAAGTRIRDDLERLLARLPAVQCDRRGVDTSGGGR
jgi:hypothetical protein